MSTSTTSGSSAASTQARSLDRGTAPERFARGWHCLGPVDAVPRRQAARRPGLRRQARRLGRARTATLNVLDGYCRHMGGDLTQGTVKGDEIACPFHDWRWGGDGKCKAIPYARRIPLRARTQKYETADAQRPADGLARRRGQPGRPRHPAAGARRHHGLRRSTPTGAGTSSTSRPRTAARSSTTSWTWRTSSTSTSPSRRASATSSRATWPPSSWSRPGGPTWRARGTATRTSCSSPRPPTTGRRS